MKCYHDTRRPYVTTRPKTPRFIDSSSRPAGVSTGITPAIVRSSAQVDQLIKAAPDDRVPFTSETHLKYADLSRRRELLRVSVPVDPPPYHPMPESHNPVLEDSRWQTTYDAAFHSPAKTPPRGRRLCTTPITTTAPAGGSPSAGPMTTTAAAAAAAAATTTDKAKRPSSAASLDRPRRPLSSHSSRPRTAEPDRIGFTTVSPRPVKDGNHARLIGWEAAKERAVRNTVIAASAARQAQEPPPAGSPTVLRVQRASRRQRKPKPTATTTTSANRYQHGCTTCHALRLGYVSHTAPKSRDSEKGDKPEEGPEAFEHGCEVCHRRRVRKARGAKRAEAVTRAAAQQAKQTATTGQRLVAEEAPTAVAAVRSTAPSAIAVTTTTTPAVSPEEVDEIVEYEPGKGYVVKQILAADDHTREVARTWEVVEAGEPPVQPSAAEAALTAATTADADTAYAPPHGEENVVEVWTRDEATGEMFRLATPDAREMGFRVEGKGRSAAYRSAHTTTAPPFAEHGDDRNIVDTDDVLYARHGRRHYHDDHKLTTATEGAWLMHEDDRFQTASTTANVEEELVVEDLEGCDAAELSHHVAFQEDQTHGMDSHDGAGRFTRFASQVASLDDSITTEDVKAAIPQMRRVVERATDSELGFVSQQWQQAVGTRGVEPRGFERLVSYVRGRDSGVRRSPRPVQRVVSVKKPHTTVRSSKRSTLTHEAFKRAERLEPTEIAYNPVLNAPRFPPEPASRPKRTEYKRAYCKEAEV